VTGILAGACGFVGLLVGSFLNVVIWRVPRGESVVRPASRCPGCGGALRLVDNVPVVSWLLLRGRCRSCAAAIPARYPLVEVSTAVLFALVGWRVGLTPELPAYLYLSGVGLALAVIDLDHRRLPDALTLPSYAVLTVLLGVASLVLGDGWALVRAGLGMAALYAFYFVVMLVQPRGMGFGDVKLAGVLGLALGWLGWGELVTGAFLGFLYGAGVSLLLLASRRATRKSLVPFGPFMVAGAITAVLVGDRLLAAYLGLTLG